AAIAAGIAAGTVFPKDPGFVACQGVEGSFGQQAADHLFCQPRILFFQRFADVMQAVEKGMCAYGVLPIENSIAGSVTEVYDQIRQHRFYIVRGVKLRVDHCLLARPGVKLEQIKEVVSHEQALRQCSHALEAMKGVRRTAVANTAIAAQQVAASNREDVAAIASFACTRLYGLQVLQSGIANVAGNYTRFICISRRPEIYPGANRICLMLALPHAPGALYRLLAGFAALGLNLRKIESRPIPGRDFEFMFYLTIEGSVRDPEARDLICSLESTLEVCGFLGNYGEED
ncbi:MAG: prephenate dehydratase, partial [Planctomycetes bacterium]|nr:prephenate dehydratase [Planctomycetota bacterium]